MPEILTGRVATGPQLGVVAYAVVHVLIAGVEHPRRHAEAGALAKPHSR